MKEHISAYIKELNALYQTGLTTEHSFCQHLILETTAALCSSNTRKTSLQVNFCSFFLLMCKFFTTFAPDL